MSERDHLTKVFLSMRNQLASIVSRIVPPKEIEDIVQETYVRLCQVKKQERITEPESFMVKTARNLALDFVKRSNTRLVDQVEDFENFLFGDVDNIYDETLNIVASDEEFSLFCEAVRSLPVKCRRVFVLKKVYGYTQREIAKELNISENTIETHVALGIQRCATYLINREVPIVRKKQKDPSKLKGGQHG